MSVLSFEFCLLSFAFVFAFVSPAHAVVTYQATGDWTPIEAIHDGNPATTVRPCSHPASLFLLLDSEVVLGGVKISATNHIADVTIEISQDAINWSLLRSERHRSAGALVLDFAPAIARAVRLSFKLDGADSGDARMGEVELIEAARGRIRVSAVTFTDVTENSALVRWKTSFPVKTALLYGFRPGHMESLSDPSFDVTTDHQAKLAGLLPGMDYKVWLLLGNNDAAGAGESRPFQFRTTGTPIPFAYDDHYSVGVDTASIAWSSNIPTRSRVEWRKKGEEAVRTALPVKSSYLTRNHVELSGLLPRSEYEYQIITQDSASRATATPWASLTTHAWNLAAGKKATGTFSHLLDDQKTRATGNSHSALDRVTDQKLDYFEGMATSGDPDDTDQWVEIDLGAPKKLSTIEMVWRGNAYPMSYYLLVSSDGESWSYAGFGLNAAAGAEERSARGDPLRRVSVEINAAEKIHFIKVFIPKASPYFVRSPAWHFVQLAELEAHGAWSLVSK